MKIDDAIEKKFRNNELELQLVAYIAKRSPLLATTVQPEWLTQRALADVVRVLRLTRATASVDALLHELSAQRLMKPADKELYATVLGRMDAVSVKQMNDKSALLLARQICDLSESRRCLRGIDSIVKNIGTFDVRGVKATLRDLAAGGEIEDHNRSGEYLEDFEERTKIISERMKAKAEGISTIAIPTGLHRFDQMIGGLMPGEFGVIAGQPEVGKTATLVAFAISAWLNNFSVLFCSGEMSKSSIEFRVDSNLAGIPSSAFRTGELSTNHWRQWRQTVSALRAMHSSFFEVTAFPRNFSTQDIEAEILRVQEKHGKPVHMLCIDYLNIMNPRILPRGSNKEWTQQANVIWDVKELVAETNGGISAWSAGQVKDEAYGIDKMELSHIKYARAISETAPIVVGLVRTEDDELEHRLQFQVLKMREAKKLERSLYLYPNLEVMRIHEVALARKSILSLPDQVAKERPPEPQKKRAGGGRKSL